MIVVTHAIPDGWPHPGSTVSFATDGIAAAVEQAESIASGKVIALGSPSVIRQCLERGLVTRIQVKVVPVLLGEGIRLFETLARAPIELDDPRVIEGNGVTHLTYDVPTRPASRG